MVRLSLDDPFAFALAPPPNETAAEKETRERAEAEARSVSNVIDEQIRQERIALKKKKSVKVLLLGQSESGKSATLKNFQLQYAGREWAEERASWRAVVYLNLINSILRVLDVLLREMSPSDRARRPGTSTRPTDNLSDSDLESSSPAPVYRFTDKHRLLKLRLAPLRRVQADLERKLGPGSQEINSTSGATAPPFDSTARSSQGSPGEFGISSTNGWRSALKKLRPSPKSIDRPESSLARRKEEENGEVTEILVGCKDDMKNLWKDPVVQQILAHRKSKVEDSAGFFLNDIDRIASHEYEPSDDDVVRARLRTVGVQEHRFPMDRGHGTEWVMYDVGGTRSSRATWAPYFDDADAIIFLCPISCFDEQLREDRRVNRLEDSYELWRSVCSSRLLSRAQIILFLNKCDILQNKLKRGMRVRDYIPSFGDRKNDTLTVMKYFQSHFKEISKLVSPEQRPFFIHFTSVIDTKATAATLCVVKESILRIHLRNAELIS
ncbi:G-alpha-domain-containing protein [Paxillus ammoniavirescens]|nr:G-alpha-domain-containing protein [Paxillus ammoniavirescens]